MMRRIDSETGLPSEQSEKIMNKLKELEEENRKLKQEIEQLKNQVLDLKLKIKS